MKKFFYFFKNIWLFRKVLWKHRWWDFHFVLQNLRTSLEIMEKGMHAGKEIRESREKKIEKMQRAIEILTNIEEYKYVEMAEENLGKSYYYGEIEFEPMDDNSDRMYMKENLTKAQKRINKQINKLSHDIESQEWNELWDIFRGQDYSKFDKNKNFNEQFDGTGLRGWWD